MPAEVLARWSRVATPITEEEWRARDPRLGGRIVRLRSVRAAGPFLTGGLDYETWTPRAADEAPRGYAGGFTLYLLRQPDGWIILSIGAWVT